MWLLEQSVLEKLTKALEAGLEQNWLAGGTVFSKNTAAAAVDDGVAVIPVNGILTKQADPLIQFFFGANTVYDDIIAQIGQAEANANVTAIRFDIDSPGGNVDGLFDTLAAISAAEKPMRVVARNANSAAYGIAAAAGGPIIATSPGATFGSVGILAKVAVSDSVFTLTSSSAPDKAPDPRTEEGKAAIVRHLDALEDLFVGAIANGRGITAEAVKNNFGRGATLLATEAKQRGMIDGIAGTGLRVVKTATKAAAAGGSEEGNMTLEELKAEHPALFKAVVDIGVKQERDRVCAHLQGGEMSGAPTGGMKIAHEAIREGDDLTQTVSMQYLTAAHNKRDVDARNEDDNEVTEATTNGQPKKVDEMDKLHGETLALLKGMTGEGAL
jgi:ClpP class serine protease